MKFWIFWLMLMMIPIPPQSIEPSRHERTLTMEATAYTHTGNLTKSGTQPKAGRTVAVDPSIIPLGTRLIINGQAGFVAEDTGGRIHNNKIDIFFDSKEDCIKWGVRELEVLIID